MEEITNYNHIKFNLHLNYQSIPTTLIEISEKGMNEFNEIVDYVKARYDKKLIRTKSGGISISIKNWNQFPGYDIRSTKSCIELTLVGFEGCYRFQFRNDFLKSESNGVSGRSAFLRFRDVCNKFKVDINKFQLSPEEGLEIKKQIPKPIIDLKRGFEDVILRNVHHIDIHSAHMAGMAKAFPELYEPINYCYNKRKEDPIYKGILTHTWGYCQSQYSPVYYGFSHLSKAGIEYTNSTIEDLTNRLVEHGNVVIAHNTDGIWYSGDIYHGDGEGKELGQWDNDYTNCIFRAKSVGVYEFICNGEYKPVARGYFNLDKTKPRDKWVWGDIYNTGDEILFAYDEKTEKLFRI